MQIIGSGGNGTQNCDASVQKNLEKKCDIRDKTNLRTLTPNPSWAFAEGGNAVFGYKFF